MNRRALIAGGFALASVGAASLAWMRSTGSMSDYNDYALRIRAALSSNPGIEELVRYATLAANSHNTQPWRFALSPEAIHLLPDEARRTPAVDPDDHHLYVSLGCAIENLAIAARAVGRLGDVGIDQNGASTLSFATSAPRTEPIFAAIPVRQSTRVDYDGRAVPPEELSLLMRAAAEPGVRLILITDRARIDSLRDLIVAGSDAQMEDPSFVAELMSWIRFNPRAAMQSGDGLFSATGANPAMPTFIGERAFSVFFTAGSEREKYARQIASTPVLAVFVGDKADRLHWVKVGRACQRFCLTATACGLKLAFVNQPVEVATLRPALASLIGEKDNRPDLVMRLGYGPAATYSPRRATAEVISAQ